MQPSIAATATQPTMDRLPARRPLSVVIHTRRLLPWERPATTLETSADTHAHAPLNPDHLRRAELSRQLSMMPSGLVRQLLTVALREAPQQVRHDLLVRQLRETAPAERRDLLAHHLRTLGAGLVRVGALADDEGQLPPELFEDGSLDVLLAQLGVDHENERNVTVPGVSPLCAGLAVGDGGRAVVALQARLLGLGYLTQADFAASPGEFDAATAAATRAFQSDRLLPVTGYYGVLTHLALCAETAGA